MATKTTNRVMKNGNGEIVDVAVPAKQEHNIVVSAPNMQTISFLIVGTSPYSHHKFSQKINEQMRATQEAGSVAKKGKKREGKNFEQCYLDATYKSPTGWYGMPASAFRKAMISACKLVGFHMTKGKLTIFTEADGYDHEEGTPLVKIIEGKPEMWIAPVRNANGSCDLRARPRWQPGWKALVRVKYDADVFSMSDITNLMARVGLQVGIGEGRADSKDSAGIGYGFFEISNED